MSRAAVSVLVLLLAAPAAAEQSAFTRVSQDVNVGERDFNSAWSMEMSRAISEQQRSSTPSPGGGGGGGGGTGEGKNSYQGVMHRFYAFYGPTDYFDLGAEQSIRQNSLGDFQYGVLMPRMALKLNPLAPGALGGLPVTLSTFVGSQVRINAQRDSSIITGLQLDRTLGRFSFVSSGAFETTLNSANRENGSRYEAGASYRIWSPLSAAVEAWGTLVWPEQGVFRQTHHAGPSFKLQLEKAWFSVNGSLGYKEQPNKIFWDQTYMFQVGMGL